MIAYIKGHIIENNTTDVIIDVSGIGYQVHISLMTYEQIREQKEISLHTYLHVREDLQMLYGFYTKREREVFEYLISVSGIGTNTARVILSSLTTQEIIEAIAQENFALIQTVKGIGLKTAQRTVIELKDKITKIYAVSESESTMMSNITIRSEALSALEVLGYQKKQLDKPIDKYLQQEPEATVEQVIKYILKQF